MRTIHILAATAASIIFITTANAQNAQADFERNMRAANEAAQRLQQEKDHEQMRDHSHDNRVMINKDTSVGIGGGGVNVRTTRGQ